MMGQKDRRRIEQMLEKRRIRILTAVKKNTARMKIKGQDLAQVATQTFLVDFCFQ